MHGTGRARQNGREGLAMTLFTEENKTLLINVLAVGKASGVEVPERMKWLVRMDKIRRLEVRTTKRGYVGEVKN